MRNSARETPEFLLLVFVAQAGDQLAAEIKGPKSAAGQKEKEPVLDFQEGLRVAPRPEMAQPLRAPDDAEERGGEEEISQIGDPAQESAGLALGAG